MLKVPVQMPQTLMLMQKVLEQRLPELNPILKAVEQSHPGVAPMRKVLELVQLKPNLMLRVEVRKLLEEVLMPKVADL